MKSRLLSALCVCTIPVCSFFAGTAHAISVAIVAADNTTAVQAGLTATGLFDTVDVLTDNPSLGQLSAYAAVFTWSNIPYSDPIALGDVLADYVDAGNGVVASTYAFTSPWWMQGRMATDGYLPLETGSSGYVPPLPMIATGPDPIFAGVTLSSITGNPNSNHVNPVLDIGASALALDGNGNPIIARNAMANIIGINLWPGSVSGGTADYYNLVGNSLLSVAAVPVPAAIWLFGSGLLGLIGIASRKKRLNL